MNQSSIIVAVTGGLVTFLSSILKESRKANRQQRVVDIGNRLTQFAITNFEAREKTGPIADKEKTAHVEELVRIHDAVFAEFRRGEGLEVQSQRVSTVILILRFLVMTLTILLLASAFGFIISEQVSEHKGLLIFDLVGAAILIISWVAAEAYRRRHQPQAEV